MKEEFCSYGFEKFAAAIAERAEEICAEREAAKKQNAEAKRPARNRRQFEAEAALA